MNIGGLCPELYDTKSFIHLKSAVKEKQVLHRFNILLVQCKPHRLHAFRKLVALEEILFSLCY